MISADPKVIAQIDAALERLLAAQVRLDAASKEFEDRQTAAALEFHERIAPLREEIDGLWRQIASLIASNRSMLVKRGRRAFFTRIASIEIERLATGLRVTDPEIAMSIAQGLKATPEVTTSVRETRFDPAKFSLWLKKNPQYRTDFNGLLFRPPSGTRLHVRPTTTYAVEVGDALVSPPQELTHDVMS